MFHTSSQHTAYLCGLLRSFFGSISDRLRADYQLYFHLTLAKLQWATRFSVAARLQSSFNPFYSSNSSKNCYRGSWIKTRELCSSLFSLSLIHTSADIAHPILQESERGPFLPSEQKKSVLLVLWLWLCRTEQNRTGQSRVEMHFFSGIWDTSVRNVLACLLYVPPT